MTGRQEESDVAWRPPVPDGGRAAHDADADTHDFGPAPAASSHLDDDAKTDSTRHPDPASSGPHRDPARPGQAAPGSSGPHQVNQAQSGPNQVAGQSGPHQVNPAQSGPHQVAGQSGPHGPYQGGPGQSGPHRVGQPHPYAGQPYPQAGPPPGQQRGPAPAGRSDELSSARLLKQTKRAPQSGWRKAVYKATGHLVNVGESPADLHRRELIARVNQPLRGCYKIAMLSLKGGVGKTTTTTTLGSTFSSLRGDRVIAVDANPDRGTLSQKIPLETTATVRHLLRDANRIRRYSDIRAYTSQGPSRLEVLASEQDPAVSEAFSEDDYRRTVALLEHFYNIVLTDCGTGLMHSAMKGVLDIADSLVIVSSGSVDGARSASATLDWLDAHGYRDLVARSVAVINSVRPKSGSVDLEKLSQHFGSRCRAVCRIPFDPHLEEGAEIELDRLAPETRLALLEMASTVADDFPNEMNRLR
ncbi:AAA family ATPase [Actinokineospora sp.]|uniref:AAA family ATPase n=1 Tax=Actinokineospora sp. TaxID=1872133 RepID=UPI004037E0DD